jgi:two-component system LytT family response regulator
MSNEIRVLIIDDEPLARELVKKYLAGLPGIEILGECDNGFEALKAIQEKEPDLLFLDIQMPKIDGFELLEVLDRKPEVIFTTAFDQYAIKAFEMNAIDYLLKPFSKTRLLQALEKASKQLENSAQKNGTTSRINQLEKHLDDEPKTLERVVTRIGSRLTVIPVEKIWYIEAADDYVMIYSELGNHLKEKTMKYFEMHLPADRFIRIHRKHIVNIGQITTLEQYSKDSHLVILKSGAKLKVSAEGYKRLRAKI